MNNKITALKKKIELKENQKKKILAVAEKNIEAAKNCKEAAKKIDHETVLLKNELAKEEMQLLLTLMGEKNLNIDDLKAAIASGVIVSSKSETVENEDSDTEVNTENKENTEDNTNV